MQSTPLVSVVVPVYNDIHRLEQCLLAMSSQTYPQNRFEVIVVDNGSADNPAVLKSLFRQVVFLQESRPGSYCARNKGIDVAKGDIVAFTDSDCIPRPDWIGNGVKALMTTSNCGLVAGRVKLFFKDPQHPTATEIYESIHAFDQKNMVENYQHAATANLFAYRRVIDQVGNFNAELKSGGDVEWGKRVFAAGYRQVYAHDACVLHPARRSLKEIYQKTTRVQGGLHDMGLQNDHDAKAAAVDVMKLFKSLAALMRRCLLAMSPFDRIGTARLKLQYMFVFSFVRAVKIIEQQKLQYGFRSRRA